MTLELERDERAGVVSSSPYDYYLPGYEDSVPLGHNTVCLLTEAAGARVASTIAETPVDPAAQIDAPHPWPGGPWRLRDIVDYDLSAMHGLLRGAAAYRGELVRSFYDMGRRAIEAGVRETPFAFVIPPDQHDVLALRKLEELLLAGGVEIQRSQEPFRVEQHGVSSRHRFDPAVAAVPGVREDAARTAGLPRRPQAPASGRTTRRAGRCRPRWAWTSGPSNDRSSCR